MLAEPHMPGASPLLTVAVGLIGYCVVSIVVLLAHARTRLYPLYLLKICWVGFTIVGFIWLISMSIADPGPRHGGISSEFMRNPAGPLAAVGDYGRWARRLYRAGPWWMPMLAGLLLLWRGLAGHPWAEHDSPRRRGLARGFLVASAGGLGGAVLVIDWFGSPAPAAAGQGAWWAGAAWFAAGCLLWLLLPRAVKRRYSSLALAALGALAAAPLAASLWHFDWAPYTYAARNYTFAWTTARMSKYVLNSVMVSIMTVGITCLLASMAAYALARYEFVGRNAVLFMFIGAMALPGTLYIVPLFLIIKDWAVTVGGVHFNFMDSRFGLALIYAAEGLPFSIFLLTGFYRTLPGTLREAAAIDGCGHWRTFTDVYFPLAAPGLATAAIFRFLGVWNEYQFALVFLTNERLKTLPVGLYNLSVSQQYAANWPALFAGVTILCLPTFLIFIILQERIVAGLTVGAVKE